MTKWDQQKLDTKYIHQSRASKDGEERVYEQHEAMWDEQHGAERRRAELEVEAARASEQKAKDRLDAAEADLSSTNQKLTFAFKKGERIDGLQHGDTSIMDWSTYDKFIAGTALTACIMLLTLGVANVASTILSSGIPIFLEQPWIAWMLGGLVPAGSFTLKFFYHLFRLDRTRWFYALSVYGFSVVLITLWVFLFAITFEGATGAIDWDSLGNESGHGFLDKLRTGVQILGEICIGASLFLVIDRIHTRYSSTWSMDNPAYLEAFETRDRIAADHQVAFEHLVKVEGQLDELLASRKAYCARAVAEWQANKTASEGH